MVERKPGAKPGTPSPNKKFWVIRVKGKMVRFEWSGNRQPPCLPTYFNDSKSAQRAAQLLNGGSAFIAEIYSVTRKQLESIARGEAPEVKVETFPVSVSVVHLLR